MRMRVATSCLARFSASALAFTCAASRARFIGSACRMAPSVATMAKPLGTRKLRAKPGLTSTTSPLLPSLGTSWRKMMRTSASPGDVRQQSHLARVLDGDGDITLVLGATSGDAAGADLAPLAHIPAQASDVFVRSEERRVG